MRTFLLIVLSVASLSSCATMGKQASPDKLKYQVVIEAPGVTKADLFVRANTWAVKNFTSSEAVIEFQDKEAGRLTGKFTSDGFDAVYTFILRTVFSVEIKDGKVRLTFSDPTFKYTSGMGTPYYNQPYQPVTTEALAKDLNATWLRLHKNLEATLKTAVSDF